MKQNGFNHREEYDAQCVEEFSSIQRKVDPFFVDDRIPCPYHLPHTATFHQAMFGPLNERVMELFLAAGYRRNGNSMYDMRCETCKACQSIRLHPDDFKPNRSQKRCQKKNNDIEVVIDAMRVDNERLELCDKFLSMRYPQKKNTAWGYYSCFFLNEMTSTYEILYRLEGKLIGVGIIDLGVNWMNAVYFYFDPEITDRSLGTYNILTMVDICRSKEISHLYLGYVIKPVPAMNYKENFYPHYILEDGIWKKVEKKLDVR